MTVEEMRKRIEGYCNAQDDCYKCPQKGNEYCSGFTKERADESIVRKWYKLFFGDDEPENDVINHPRHYCREGAMESIDEMLLLFGAEAVKGFCVCNAWKYRYRAADKNGEEDMRKSDWYISKYKELCEKEKNDA